MCNKFLEGVLYYEVVEPTSFTRKLTKYLDIILGYFSATYTMYYSLSVDQGQTDTLDMMTVLLSTVVKFQAACGITPALFIDGANLLAKNEINLSICMLIQAKSLANEGVLTIVFVSSEGFVVPVIQQM